MTNCFSTHERVILVLICLFPALRSNEGNKHQNNAQVSTETVHHRSTYIILFLTRHDESINEDKNNDIYTSSLFLARRVFVLVMTSQFNADDVKITDNCDAITWIVISNSLGISFIHGDIHGRSCKKYVHQWLTVNWVIIGSGNDLLCYAKPSIRTFSEIWIKIQKVLDQKMHGTIVVCKM